MYITHTHYVMDRANSVSPKIVAAVYSTLLLLLLQWRDIRCGLGGEERKFLSVLRHVLRRGTSAQRIYANIRNYICIQGHISLHS